MPVSRAAFDSLKPWSAVARIGENTQHGFGTGFLLDGGLLSIDLAGQFVLLTNAHIVSDDPNANNGSLTPKRAVATLETVGKHFEIRFAGVIRTSPIDELDTTILALDNASRERLSTLNLAPYTIAQKLPEANTGQPICLIGYPNGGRLRISVQNNFFLAGNDRFLHYHAPTEYGSSGSPVFNENWELIGIHHAGGPDTPRLDEPLLTYDAAEGIRISAIQQLFETL